MFNRFIAGIICSLSIGACSAVSPHVSAPVHSTSALSGKTDMSIPTASSTQYPNQASATEAKYRVLSYFPKPFFCDLDQYPIAHDNQAEQAKQHLSELQANQEEFQVILKHNGLVGLSNFNAEQAVRIYQEHKKLQAIQLESAGNHYRFLLQIMEGKQQGFIVKGVVESSGSVKIEERTPNIAMCPVCLSAQTLIDTPKGGVAVEKLQNGDPIWTVNASGVRIAATVVKTSRVPVPANHQMMHIVLEDKRKLWVSPGHQTVDKRNMGDLQTGDILDGSRILLIAKEPYTQTATYDLLPSGPTGNYWANRILISSTLSKTHQ